MDARVEIRDVAPGLWLWRQAHPDWRPGLAWEPQVSSFCVESRGEVLVLDALEPQDGSVWERLDARPPTVAVVLKPDHVRDVDLFVRRYNARAFGPIRYFKSSVPETDLVEVLPDDELPGGLLALDDGRRRHETPLYLPEQRALVFADGLTAPEGVLRVWHARRYEQQVLPALRAMLELPFDHVLVSHGDPVHDRAEFERALEREPWEAE
jgi:glyoxylase-like metal-dependent hydrolase (beta-lactamase superfamily II)